MFDAVMKGALAAVNLSPEDAHKLVTDAFAKVDQIDARLARIERALNVRNTTDIQIIEVEKNENVQETGTNG